LHTSRLFILAIITVHAFSMQSLHPLGISSKQWCAIEAARQEQKNAAAKTLPLPFQTLAGVRFLVHNWFGSGSEDVRAVAASQHHALGPSGDVQEPGDASLPSCCCG
jgi:hypothetical protein